MYVDTVGVATIGYGHALPNNPISLAAAELILDDDIAEATADCIRAFPWFSSLDPVRKDVLINLVFNLGIAGVSRFHRMIAALAIQNWDTASQEMLASQWAGQVGARAVQLALMLKLGRYPDQSPSQSPR